MKKYKIVIIVILFEVVIIAAITYYIARDKDLLIYQYMLYDHIQYNGKDYYAAKDQHYSPSESGEIRGPVYLVYKSLLINYGNCNTAYVHTGYEGEEKEIYLFFDSAIYIRGDFYSP